MKRRIVTVLLIAAMVLAACAHAAFTGEHVFHNELETSGVGVEIRQLHMDENGLVSPANHMTVMPGEDSSYIPRVTGLKRRGYVRVSVSVEGKSGKEVPVSADNAYGIGDDWIKRGNCFYCTRVLEQGQSSDVFQGIHIPEDWECGQDDGFTVRLVADEIQAENFTPDFSGNSPWGTVFLQEVSAMDETAERSARTAGAAEGAMDFTYTGSGGLECSTGDLFSGFGSLVPGDVCRGTLNMRNATKNRMAIRFRTANLPTKLMEEVRLHIACGDANVYDGALTSDSLSEFRNIGTIPAGESRELAFAVYLPESAGDEFAELKDSVTWIIALDEIEDDVRDGKAVRTGDEMFERTCVAFAICTLMLAVMVALMLRRRRM